MGKVHFTILTVVNMKVNGRKTLKTAMVSSLSKMVLLIKDHLKTIEW